MERERMDRERMDRHTPKPFAPGSLPQRQFQNQFHTQFVPAASGPAGIPVGGPQGIVFDNSNKKREREMVRDSRGGKRPRLSRPVRSKVKLHLGTYIWPKVPFPFHFPPPTPKEEFPPLPNPVKEGEEDAIIVDCERIAEVLVPSGFFPDSRPPPGKTKIWGGGDSERRVYTDDSDLFSCAVHAGWVTYSGARKAKKEGSDLRVRIRIIRVSGRGPEIGHSKEEVIGRFLGGWGEGEGEGEEDDGRGLMSCGWGTGHDGSAIEVLGVEWISKRGGRGKAGRKQRLDEYGQRRQEVMSSPEESEMIMMRFG